MVAILRACCVSYTPTYADTLTASRASRVVTFGGAMVPCSLHRDSSSSGWTTAIRCWRATCCSRSVTLRCLCPRLCEVSQAILDPLGTDWHLMWSLATFHNCAHFATLGCDHAASANTEMNAVGITGEWRLRSGAPRFADQVSRRRAPSASANEGVRLAVYQGQSGQVAQPDGGVEPGGEGDRCAPARPRARTAGSGCRGAA